jgi:hypothetical protein
MLKRSSPIMLTAAPHQSANEDTAEYWDARMDQALHDDSDPKNYSQRRTAAL